MGTTRSGRYLSTKGGRNHVSDYALVHSMEGDYDNDRITGIADRLSAGGHGAESIGIMKRAGLRFEITRRFDNGVLLGSITDSHKSHDRVTEGHAWFPLSWTPNMVRKAGDYVASMHPNSDDGEIVTAMWHGVVVGIIRRDGRIDTVCPSYNQPGYPMRTSLREVLDEINRVD